MGENRMRDGTWCNQVDNFRMDNKFAAAAVIRLS